MNNDYTTENGFISVKDALPPTNTPIIAYNPITGPFQTTYTPEQKGKEWKMTSWGQHQGSWFPKATHWKLI